MVFPFARIRFRPTIFVFTIFLTIMTLPHKPRYIMQNTPAVFCSEFNGVKFCLLHRRSTIFGVSRTGMDIYRLLAAAHNRYTPSIYTIT